MADRFPGALLALITLLAACGNESTASSSPAARATTSAATSTATLPSRTDPDWPMFMGDPQRSGVGPATPVAVNPHRTWTAPVDGDVYGSPVAAGSTVIAVTERDSVYALDAASGAVKWRAHLGEPVALSKLVCGNIDPNGITSTPVIDTAAGIVYTVAMFDAPMRHELFALRLADGSVVWHRAVDAPDADPRIHQQRAALNLAGGQIYIAYGGFTGDCGEYHGRVVSAPTDGSGPLRSWTVPSNLLAGVWAAAGPVISPQGDVWVSTGNTEALRNDPSAYDTANAVVRLDGGLSAAVDQWAPRNWASLNQSDTDIGSASPALLPGGLVFIAGKEGIGYLLRAAHLGGIGGEVFKDTACAHGGPTMGSFGGVAVAAGMVFVPCKDDLTALRVDTSAPSFSVAWRAAPGSNSPVLAYGLVWTVSASVSGYRQSWTGSLAGIDPLTGAVRANVDLGPLAHFPSPAVAGGALYVGGQGSVYAVRVT